MRMVPMSVGWCVVRTSITSWGRRVRSSLSTPTASAAVSSSTRATKMNWKRAFQTRAQTGADGSSAPRGSVLSATRSIATCSRSRASRWRALTESTIADAMSDGCHECVGGGSV
eukprot:Amastigsp_a856369_6.p3 type:complete len:114 gc:universal Amastigsp_a856369_6:738-397(-)